MRLLKEYDSCILILSSAWDMIVFHMFCYMDASADSDLKEDLERNGWTISSSSAFICSKHN